jgi:hypothetical protein
VESANRCHGATWTVSYAKFGCRSDLYFEHPDPVVNLARWRLLYRRKDDVVAALGGELTFDELPNNKGCRIEARLNGWRWSLARRRRGRIDLLSRTEEVRHPSALPCMHTSVAGRLSAVEDGCDYHTQWAADGTVTRVHDAPHDRVHAFDGRAAERTAALIDSQSVRCDNTDDDHHAGMSRSVVLHGPRDNEVYATIPVASTSTGTRDVRTCTIGQVSSPIGWHVGHSGWLSSDENCR